MGVTFEAVRLNERSLKTMCGAIVDQQIVAITELVANAWDAGAQHVDITLPKSFPGQVIISDDGCGMSDADFEKCWREIQFERRRRLNKPQVNGKIRAVFGRNGLGRFGVFAFADVARIESSKDGKIYEWEAVWKHGPLVETALVREEDADEQTGTTITITAATLQVTVSQVLTHLGSRFVADPDFEVRVNNEAVSFRDFQSGESMKIACSFGDIELIALDRMTPPGVAWWVGNRLVGDVTHKGYFENRARALKELMFVVKADALEAAVLADWSGFSGTPAYLEALALVQNQVRESTSKIRTDAQTERRARLLKKTRHLAQKAGPEIREKLEEFIELILVHCPSLKDHDIESLANVLISMEQSRTGYSLIHQLAEIGSAGVDELDKIMQDWELHRAKQVLQLVQDRLLALKHLEGLMGDMKTDEVHQLQPAVMECLWIFGPEYESPEFTSNKTIMSVLAKFGGNSDQVTKEGARRPDFVVVEEGVVSCRARDGYDGKHEARGLASVLIVELKRPSVRITSKALQQCREYVELLRQGGTISDATRVEAIALGANVDPLLKAQDSGNEHYTAMTLGDFVRRGERRLLGLREHIKDAPFLETTLGDYLIANDGVSGELGL